MKLQHEAFLPAGPRVGRGAVRVGEGEEEKRVEVGGIFDDGGELRDDLRVVEIAGGGKAPEGQVVVDQKHDERAARALNLQAVAESRSEHGRAVDVFADVFGAAGVVKNDGEVERVGVGDFVEEAAIDSAARVVLGDELVELFDAAQRVFVGGVAVEKFVLNEAIECAEFRQIASEESDAVHESQDASDIALAFEDRLESFAVGF